MCLGDEERELELGEAVLVEVLERSSDRVQLHLCFGAREVD